MQLEKAARRKASISPTANPIFLELIRLLWFAAATLLLIALASYSASDPSWSTWSNSEQIQNWLGRGGSIGADMMLQLIGLSAFFLPAWLFLQAFLPAERRAKGKALRAAGASVFFVAASSLLQCAIPRQAMPLGLKYAGGVVGEGGRKALEYLAGPLGAVLISLFLVLAAIIVVLETQILSRSCAWILREIPHRLRVMWAGIKARSSALLAESRLRWQARRVNSTSAISADTVAVTSGVSSSALSQLGEASPRIAPSPALQAVALPTPSGPVLPPVLNQQDEEAKSRDLDELARVMGSAKMPRGGSGGLPTQPKGPKISNRSFSLPSISMLTGKAENKPKQVDKNWYLDKANILVQKLRDFGVEGEVVNISPGPVITVYEFKPASGVKIKEIANLSDDLTLALSVLSVRIVAPIPGKPVVGIEIPSPYRETVYFKDMIQETPFFGGDIRIPVVLGRLASGEPVAADLASMPHLLVAGTTGTGKSVFINTLIASLIFRFTPKQLKLILVDPKMVELSLYEGIPHLLLPVVVDSKKAVLALRWAVEEMERRYTKMHQFGVRHVDAYNLKLGEKGSAEGNEEHPFLPYIVVVIDEYADLMSVVPKDVELSIARLAQKARASGIHLVLATQRPSTDVVTGTIKANFPSRISFRVASSVDSKTILDRTGADRLLGNGDMLFHSAGFSSLKRMQGSFVSDADVARVVEYLKSQGEPEYNEAILAPVESESTDWNDELASDEERDNRLFDAAVRLVSEKGEASISLIQRHLKIGYNRAASLMEELEQKGIVAQATSNSKRRAVLVNQI